MYVFKPLDKSDITFEENEVYNKQTLTTGSVGLSSIQYRSGSHGTGSEWSSFSTAGHHWNFLHYNCYLSGSSNINTDETSSFNSVFHSLLYKNNTSPQHRNKFDQSGSVIYIPNHYIGDKIKRNSFQLTDLTYSSSIDNTINPIIKDDGYGNLYSTNAYHSQSGATSISSSDNYVGNILYEQGIVTLTETASWSGSVNYTDLTTDNYGVNYDSTFILNTLSIMVEVRPEEFNQTLNLSARGHNPSDTNLQNSPYLNPKFTSSKFEPYITQMAFFEKDNVLTEPLIVANFSQPIRKADDITYTFKVEIDL